MINRYTVIGQPVAHSMSPAIHHLFGELTQRRVLYTRSEATPENFSDTVLQWQKNGGQGCNITLPFKQLALKICDRLSPSAQLAQAVNTIHMHRDGNLVGHNTDGSGLCTDLEINQRFAIAGQHVLLLGAGGAARGALGPLLEKRPALVHIANRSADRAKALAASFAGFGTTTGGGYDTLDTAQAFDLVINATSLSLQGEIPPLPEHVFAAGAVSYDMMYGKDDTSFMSWSRTQGVGRVCGGFGMLVEQAADAFFIWEGARPKTRMVFTRLHDLIGRSYA